MPETKRVHQDVEKTTGSVDPETAVKSSILEPSPAKKSCVQSAIDRTANILPTSHETQTVIEVPDGFSKEHFEIEDLELDLFQGLPTGSDCDGTGGFVWEAGLCLAEFLIKNKVGLNLASQHIIELGSGSGLAGIVAALCGAPHVVLTDLDQMVPHIRQNVGLNAARIAGRVEVLPLDWDRCDKSLISQYDMVLGADLLYDSANGSGAGMCGLPHSLHPLPHLT
jgi:ribosomal protein L11 methylase PrmA